MKLQSVTQLLSKVDQGLAERVESILVAKQEDNAPLNEESKAYLVAAAALLGDTLENVSEQDIKRASALETQAQAQKFFQEL